MAPLPRRRLRPTAAPTTANVCHILTAGLPEPVPPLIKNASLASIMRARSCAAPGVMEPEAVAALRDAGCGVLRPVRVVWARRSG